ncbi:MFS transporter [Streptomyces sp. CA-111067]|uniref:MFS transporter n=1 Tax=Streptomyces sp. CA-111067 TaxID=3240046 RepID=UPI003D96C56D
MATKRVSNAVQGRLSAPAAGLPGRSEGPGRNGDRGRLPAGNREPGRLLSRSRKPGRLPSEARDPGRRHSPGLTLTASLLGFFLITLDGSVVNVALPAIGHDLHGELSALQWVMDGYTLAFAALMLSTGALSDRIGASRAFPAGVAVFTAASAGCGLAPTLPVLITGRVVQGVAAAVVLPSSLALIRQAFPDAGDRARAISVWAAGASTAIALGPVAGGALTTAWGWRGIFFVNLPVGVATVLLTARTARSPRRPAPLDTAGQLTAVLALAALTFAVIESGRRGLLALAVAAVAGAAFFVIESRHPHPVVPLGLFRNATVSVSIATGSAFSFAFYGMIFALSLYLQQIRGLSPLTTGLMFVPMTLLISTVNVVAGRVANRYGPRRPMIAGQLLMIAGLLVLLLVGSHTPLPLLAVAMVPLALGGALVVPPLTTATLEAVPAERAGLASGVLNSGRQVAGGLGVAVFGTLVADQAHFQSGLRISLLIATALLAATTTATVLALRPAAVRPTRRSQTPAPPALNT